MIKDKYLVELYGQICIHQSLKISKYLTLSDVGQHFTGMRCYFHNQQSHFLDVFHYPVPDGAAIYVDDIPFWHDEKEETYTEVLDCLTGNILLATSREQEFLLNYRNIVLHTSAESWRPSHNCWKILVPTKQPICNYDLQITFPLEFNQILTYLWLILNL